MPGFTTNPTGGAPATPITPTSAPDATAPVAPSAPVAPTGSVRSILDFIQSSDYVRPSLMTPAGEKFVEDLKVQSSRCAEIVKFALDIRPVSYIDNIAGVAITDKPTAPEHVILLMFADSMQNAGDQIPSEYASRVLKQSGLLPQGYDVNMHTGEVYVKNGETPSSTPSLDQVLTIEPTDYANPEKVMRVIYNKFATLRYMEPNMTVHSILNHNEALYICTNIETVRNFAARNTMHNVPSRCDYGFVAFIAPAAYLADLKNRGNMNLVNTATEGFKPLLGAVGYTTFTLKQQNQGYLPQVQNPYAPVPPPFMPVSHFEIIAPVSSLRMSVLAQALAGQFFIKDKLWMTPFNNFSETSPFNLGRLIVNQKDNTFDLVDSQQKLNEYFMYKIDSLNPLLAMDITEGRDRVTSIDAFADKRRGNAVCSVINSFFGKNLFEVKEGFAPWLIQDMVWKEYIGLYQNEKAEWRDTRELDQLRCATMLSPKTTGAELWELLENQSFNHLVKLKTLQQHFHTIKSLYCLEIVPLAAAYVNTLATTMMETFNGRIYSDLVENAQGFVPVSNAFAIPQNYTGNIIGGAQYSYGGSVNAQLTLL